MTIDSLACAASYFGAILIAMSPSVMICDKTVSFSETLATSLGSRGWAVTLLTEAEIASRPHESAHRGPKSRAKDASSASAPDGADATMTRPESPVSELQWNRASVLSARTVALALERGPGGLDHAVIVFDSVAVARGTPSANRAALADAADRHVKGMLLLVSEVSALFIRQGRGRLTFLLRDAVESASASALPRPSERTDVGSHANRDGADAGPDGFAYSGAAVASIARGAYVALAEETAAAFAAVGNPALQTLLVRLDQADDALNLEWLVARLSSENPPRAQGAWVKSGSRGLFGIL